MKKRLFRALLCVAGTVGIAYGSFAMLFPTNYVHAGGGCCNSDPDCGGGLNYCNAIGCIIQGQSYNGVCDRYE